jgi:hypothetical protein
MHEILGVEERLALVRCVEEPFYRTKCVQALVLYSLSLCVDHKHRRRTNASAL